MSKRLKKAERDKLLKQAIMEVISEFFQEAGKSKDIAYSIALNISGKVFARLFKLESRL